MTCNISKREKNQRKMTYLNLTDLKRELRVIAFLRKGNLKKNYFQFLKIMSSITIIILLKSRILYLRFQEVFTYASFLHAQVICWSWDVILTDLQLYGCQTCVEKTVYYYVYGCIVQNGGFFCTRIGQRVNVRLEIGYSTLYY